MKKSRYFYSLLAKYLLPILIPFLLLVWVAAFAGFTLLRSVYNDTNQKLLNSALSNVEHMVNEMDTLMLSFDTNPGIINRCFYLLSADSYSYYDYKNLDYINTMLNSPANASKYIHSIYVYYPNETGRFLQSNDFLGTLQNVRDTGWYDSYLLNSERQMWSERRSIPGERPPVVTIYKRLKYDGVIVLNLNIRSLEEVLAGARYFDDQIIYILNDEGVPIFSSSGLIPLGDAQELSAAAAKPDGKAVKLEDGREYIIYGLYSAKYQWSYLSLVPTSSYYSMPTLILKYMAVALAILLVCGVVVALLSARRGYRDIHSFELLIRQAQSGHYEGAQLKNTSSNYTSYVTQQLLSQFIEQDYLKVQLSERKYKLRSMELLAMQSQINPHFLYNTLETISMKSMAITGGRTELQDVMEDLSELLNYALDTSSEWVSMREEIEKAICYVKILAYRFEDQFAVEWDYPPEVCEVQTVKFVLQPLIENAVTHGVREREQVKGRIRVRIRRRDDQMVIEILDNGVGIPRQRLQRLQQGLVEGEQGAGHIGLYNTNRRFQLAYGETYHLDLLSKQGWGTKVRVVYPLDVNK